MLAKSLDLCASSQNHQTPWQYYNNGHLERDDTFGIVELCHFNFESLMTQVFRVNITYYLLLTKLGDPVNVNCTKTAGIHPEPNNIFARYTPRVA